MKLNIKFVSLLLILFLISMAVVSANEDNNQTLKIDDNEILSEDIATDTILEVDDNDLTFTDLNRKISVAEEGDTVTLDSNYYRDDNFNIYGVYITKTLTIDGKGMTLDGRNSGRIFQITADNVVLKNLVFTNGYHNTTGGAVMCNGSNLHVENCIFINNTCEFFHGGALCIYNNGSSIINSQFINNYVGGSGGAIRVNGRFRWRSRMSFGR